MVDPNGLIAVGAGLIATLVGVWATRAGQADSRRQQEAALRLEEREQRNAQNEAALKHAKDDATWLATRAEDLRLQVERVMAEKAAEVIRLAKERDDIDMHLRGQLRVLDADLAAMRALVVTQINQESERTASALRERENPES